jgi:hypothetical protein
LIISENAMLMLATSGFLSDSFSIPPSKLKNLSISLFSEINLLWLIPIYAVGGEA